MSIPALGLGTFRLTGQTVIDSIRNGLDVGYRTQRNDRLTSPEGLAPAWD